MSLIKKYYYRIGSPLRRMYWFLFRPETFGVKVVISHSGKFLCVRNTYGTKVWTFPGGGVRRGESFKDAARREVLEEVGIQLDSLEEIGHYFSSKEYKKDIVHCFYAETPILSYMIDKTEILEAGWFTLDEIPEPRSSAVSKIRAML